MSATLRAPANMTVAEFLEWCPDDGQRWQLIDGEPVAMAPAKVGHGVLQALVAARLVTHLADRRSPCTVVTAPGVVPKVRADFNFRVPDLAVTCAPVAANDVMLREPVLVVEILSAGNARDTWANVWAYASMPSVKEILVLRTATRCAELLRRDAQGEWPARPLIVTDGTLELDSIGYAAPIEALYPAGVGQ
ncbi:Uma2 family endonuclease [Roseomonas sp. AR75]|jgi:Uma2 family endonuclease|uniref:Uma2 family endonuclease n=1 Tax=Roseomonas sp. AR75 TaxID=2562311 RepID=UPI0010BFE08F|nr:Uma2 family endonuclease [Roseomonas sp. AR75]